MDIFAKLIGLSIDELAAALKAATGDTT